eukprot:353643-Chlamydomonas_euryale.AAC.2
MSLGRRSRPIMPGKAEVGPRLRTCMHVNALGLWPWAFACMHVRGRGPAKAEAGVIGRVKHVLCKDDPAEVSQTDKHKYRPLMHTA